MEKNKKTIQSIDMHKLHRHNMHLKLKSSHKSGSSSLNQDTQNSPQRHVSANTSVDQPSASKMVITPEIQKGLSELKRNLVSLIAQEYSQVMCTNKKFIASPESNYYELWISKELFKILIYNKSKIILTVEYKWLLMDALVNGKKGSIADVNHLYQQFLGDLEAKKVEMFDVK